MFRKHKHAMRLSIESLEARWLMAGDVAAYLEPDPFGFDTVLVVEGDSEANQIRVVEDAPGHARIEGLDGTTVNGMAADELFSDSALFLEVRIDLGNGDDAITYESAAQNYHNTKIDTGNGTDSVSVAVLVQDMAGYFTIDTGNHDDDVTFDMAAGSIIGGLRVTTGLGDDSVLVRADNTGDIPILRDGFDSAIVTEKGNDSVQFEGDFDNYGRLLVSLGAGNDTLIGDPTADSPSSARVEAVGGLGEDTVVNSTYFVPHFLHEFEWIDDE